MFAEAWRQRRGSVSLLAAGMFPVLIGVSGLGVEYGYGVLTHVEDQRVADLTAYAGAQVYSNNGNSTSKMTTAVDNLAAFNGISSNDISASIVSRTDGNSAVQVTVSTSVPRVISRIFGGASTIPVSATAYVEMIPGTTPGCIIALKTSGTGVVLSGGTSVTATSCTVASNGVNGTNGSVTVPNGTSVTTPIVDFTNTIPTADKNNIHAPSGAVTYKNITTVDPLCGSGATCSNTTISGLTGRLSTVAAMTSPAAPTVTAPSAPSAPSAPTASGGTSVTLSYYMTSAPALPTGCTLAGYTAGPWTITCAGAGPFNFANLSTGPAATITTTSTSPVTVNVSGTMSGTWNFTSSATNTYNFMSGISTSASATFPAGTYNINGNLSTSSSYGTNIFGAGTYNITGNLTTGSTTTFGNANFNVGGYVTTGGSSTTFGAGNFKVVGSFTTAGTTNFGAGNVTVGGNLTTAGSTGFGAGNFSITGNVTTAGTTTFGAGNVSIGGNLTTAGTTNFGNATTFNVGGYLSAAGSTTFGTGAYNIADGITTGGGSTTSFGAGSFNLGGNTVGSSSKFSIYHTGSTLTFAGPSSFVLSNGIYVSGGETVTMGSGTTNSYQIGASTDATSDAIEVGGGATLKLADATGTGDLFQMAGPFNQSGGGSCVSLPAANAHDINGYFSMAGGAILGAGVYTITGYVALGNGGGGAVTCGGSSVGLKGSGVTLVIGANTTLSSGTCSGLAFCVTGGYSNVTLTAPSSDLVVVGPTSASAKTAGALFTAGATGASLSGVFYFPIGQVALGGGASLGGGTGQCLELIGSQIVLSGGSAVASACTGLTGTGTTTAVVALVQ